MNIREFISKHSLGDEDVVHLCALQQQGIWDTEQLAEILGNAQTMIIRELSSECVQAIRKIHPEDAFRSVDLANDVDEFFERHPLGVALASTPAVTPDGDAAKPVPDAPIPETTSPDIETMSDEQSTPQRPTN